MTSSGGERQAPHDAAPESETAATAMPLLEHLDELRRRLLRAIVGIVVTFLLCWWQADAIFSWCEQPYREVVGEPLSVIAVTEGFFIKLRVSFLASLFLSAPWWLAQVWGFISPGLYPRERKLAVPFVFFTSLCFLAGGAFGYWVGMPAMLDFLIGQASATFDKDIRAESYISTFSHVILGLGIVFEMPVLAFFLARLDLVRASFLIRKARHAAVVIALMAALITPSGDIPTMVVFALPMMGLYVVSIGVAWLARPRRRAREGAGADPGARP